MTKLYSDMLTDIIDKVYYPNINSNIKLNAYYSTTRYSDFINNIKTLDSFGKTKESSDNTIILSDEAYVTFCKCKSKIEISFLEEMAFIFNKMKYNLQDYK